MTRGLIPVSAIVLILLCVTAFAQETATIQATATVLPALTVTGNNDLRFEIIMPGIDKSVDKTAVGHAGEFQVQGSNLAEVTLDFDLPDSLTRGTQFIPLTFSTTDASYDDGTAGGQQAPAGTINPNLQTYHRLGAVGQMNVWIGGTVHPGAAQNLGDYGADITLTVSYTGN